MWLIANIMQKSSHDGRASGFAGVNRYFADEERTQFAALPDPLRRPAFLRGWTCKEALLKGIGSGVRDLRNCAVCLDPDAPPRVLRSPQPGWRLATWTEVEIGVAVAVLDGEGVP